MVSPVNYTREPFVRMDEPFDKLRASGVFIEGNDDRKYIPLAPVK